MHQIRPLPFKPPRLQGLSERLLASHYENNYGGAVRRLNAIEAKLSGVDWETASVFDVNGLKREELIAANSMVLHEIYFNGLGGTGDPADSLAERIERDFGSVEAWRREFTAMGKALAGGSGWVLLAWSERHGKLVNQWASDHAHCLADGRPVLALDMYEHAYHLDYGARAGAYVDAFMRNIAWERVNARYRSVVEGPLLPMPAGAPSDPSDVSAADLREMMDQPENMIVLDVCLAEDLAKRSDMLPGAELRPPETVAAWSRDLPRDKPVVVYCVYGFQVSRDAVAELRRQGIDARALAGGIAAWHASGGPTVPLNPP
jgi:superoxide dismutase, Fe-Mn family